MPLIITDTKMEVPRPWIMASKLQDIGLDNLEADIIKGLGIWLDATEREGIPTIIAENINTWNWWYCCNDAGAFKITHDTTQMNPENNNNNNSK